MAASRGTPLRPVAHTRPIDEHPCRVLYAARMIYGGSERNGRRRLLAGALALAAATLTACSSGQREDPPAAAAPQHFGPAGYRKLTLTMSEADALAAGDLRSAPSSTVQGWKVYSFADGPQPDPSRMAADEKLEKELETAEKDAASMAGQARVLELRAASMRRMADRLTGFMDAGGASFTDGRIDSIAAPKEAATEAGIKRGSTLAELRTAYQSKDLRSTSEHMYVLPVEGNPGWVLQFEIENDAVKFMALNDRDR
jgi:hypothetical protein